MAVGGGSINGGGFMGGPPGGDYTNYQYTPGIGWFYVGNEEEGTAGKSSYLNSANQRVHYTPKQKFDWSEMSERRDNDIRRQTADEGWLVGGEIIFDYQNTDPNWRPGRTSGNGTGNPGDPGWGGGMMTVSNPSTRSMSVEDFGDRYGAIDYTSGWDSIKRDGYYELQKIHGGRSQNPYGNYMSTDMESLRDLYRTNGYNPLYGTQEGRAYENRRENNALDYLYDKFKGRDMITQRRELNKKLDSYLDNTKQTREGLMGRRMTERMFNDMGLADLGLSYDDTYSPKREIKENPLGVGEIDRSGGGFLDAYNKERERQNNRKSVMSLFKEMEEFDK